jgi:REP element-mobilizing transposase RayT
MVYPIDNPPYFYTTTILNWQHLLVKDEYKHYIMNSLKFLVEDKRIYLYGFIIMPNHIHLEWMMRGDHSLAEAKNSFMKFTAQQMKLDMLKSDDPMPQNFKSTKQDRKFQLWERNSLSVPAYSREVMEQQLDYIHNNPVQKKWRLAEIPEEYYFSSARFYLLNIDDSGFITHYMEHV